MKKVKLTAVIAMICLCHSCATIFSGSRQKFTISSNIDSANISITNIDGREVYTGKTPTVTKLRRSSGYFQKAEYQVKLSADGYQEKTVPIKFGLNGWYFGNILVGGLVGIVGVDPGTGAMWKSKTKAINETLEKK